MSDNNAIVRQSKVTLMHYSAWPDCDVPSTNSDVENIVQIVEALFQKVIANETKALVHCRKGLGRTGSMIMIVARMV